MRNLVLLCLLSCLCFSYASVDPSSIDVVNVIFMNHLDVGFDGIDPIAGFSRNVVNRYFEKYFPDAVQTAKTLKGLSGDARLVYTTHSYLVSLYLDCPAGMQLSCPSESDRTAFLSAIAAGDIAWHAFPFNAQVEWAEPSLVEYGVIMSQELAQRYNMSRAVDVMSQRDVPGTTVSLVPLLAKHGVKALTIGVNAASAPVEVPKIFQWKHTESGEALIVMYHPSGYGGIGLDDCVMIEGFNRALAFAFRSDNAGPPGVDEVQQVFAQLHQQFPRARVEASSFTEFVAQLTPSVVASLPTYAKEMGDTWIYGVPSDPKKVSMFREVSRARAECLQSGMCRVDDPVFANFSRLLIKGIEHTWGGDVKTFLDASHCPDYQQWSNTAFASIVNQSDVQDLVGTWYEQREWAIDMSIQALQLHSHPLAAEIKSRLQKLEPQMPDTTGYQVVSDKGQLFDCGAVQLSFDSQHGGITYLKHLPTNQEWADSSHPIAEFVYQTFSPADVDKFLSQYMNCDYEHDCIWAGLDFGKVNLSNADPQSMVSIAHLEQVYFKKMVANDEVVSSFLLQLSLPSFLQQQYGAPQQIWLQWDVAASSGHMELRVNWFNKTTTRLPEALWITFAPSYVQSVMLEKAGWTVNASEVLNNGSQHLHGFSKGFTFVRSPSLANGMLEVSGWDAAVASVGRLTAYPVPLTPTDPTAGLNVNLYNNLWGTNYIMWYPFDPQDSSSMFRFSLNFH